MPSNVVLYLPTEPVVTRTTESPHLPTADAGLMTTSLRRLLQVTSVLWMFYFGLLAAIDEWFIRNRTGAARLPDQYYLGHISIAIGVLIVIHWPALQRRLNSAFLPLIICGMSAVPIMLDRLVLPNPLFGPIIAQEGLLTLRLLPSICVGLVLVAWFYRWRHVVAYVIGTTGITIVTHLYHSGFGIMLAALVVQSITLLLFGYAISVLTIRLKLQRAELMAANRQLQDYASTQERLTISRERNRVARELHDTLAHTLSGLTVQLETIKAYWDVDATTAKKLLDTALQTSRTGLHETRRALGALRVSPIDDLGLCLALQTMIESAAAAAQLRLMLQLPDEFPQLAPEVEQAIYRVVQEAITNVTNHAQAHTLTVNVVINPTNLTVRVDDDGCGFNSNHEIPIGHYGIAGMRERITLLGGEFRLTSLRGKGTRILATLPYAQETHQ